MKLNRHKKTMALMLTATLTLGTMSISPSQAATSLKLSEKSVTITVGKSTTITANKKIKKWKSNNKNIATVKKLANKKAKITGRKKGNCKITATNGKKTVKVNVTVREKSTTTATPTIATTPVVTTIPEGTSTIPVVTNTPVVTKTPVTTSSVETPVVSTNPAVTDSPVNTDTPAITEKPEVPATPSATGMPVSSSVPTATDNSVATELPSITTVPAITTTPVITTQSAIETTSSAAIDMSKLKATFAYSDEKILTIENENSVDFQFYTNGYYLEQKTDDTWIPLPAVAIYRDPIPAVLKANSSISYSVDYLDDYGTLKDGTYRIVVALFYTAPDVTETTIYYVNSEFTISNFPQENITMTVTEQSDKRLSITIKNNKSCPIQLEQTSYDIEVRKDDDWLPLPSTMVLRPNRFMEIAGNATTTFSIDYTEYYGILPVGTYRMVLPVWQSGNDTNHTILYETFTID